MEPVGQMQLGRFNFAITSASFRYITNSWTGPGWDFNFNGVCVNDDSELSIFPTGICLYTEAAPLPLAKSKDYSGIDLILPSDHDEASGEALFGLFVGESNNVRDVRLQFLERSDARYLIAVTGTVDTVFEEAQAFTLKAWADERPDHSYPR
jgi:hypothetical protein